MSEGRESRVDEFEQLVEGALDSVRRTLYASVIERLERCSLELERIEHDLDCLIDNCTQHSR